MEGVVIGALVGGALLFALWAANQESKDSAAQQASANEGDVLFRKILRLVLEHRATLKTKRLQLVTHDAYGTEQMGPWFKEVQYFTASIVHPRIGHLHTPKHSPLDILTLSAIEVILKNPEPENTALAEELGVATKSAPTIRTPLAFEAECAEAARRAGWSARTTKASGDQGVDVIAELGDLRVVLQCKLRMTPVGNAAVQEIAAGKQFERAQFAAVVTNATYTQSARQLAAATGVALLHESEVGSYLAGLAAVHN